MYRVVTNKLDIIESELCNFDIICLTETWLDGRIPNNDLSLKVGSWASDVNYVHKIMSSFSEQYVCHSLIFLIFVATDRRLVRC